MRSQASGSDASERLCMTASAEFAPAFDEILHLGGNGRMAFLELEGGRYIS
jgi:hypothetical protein